MQLEDYFEFHTTPVESIRLKGSRIDIDTVLELYRSGRTPEQIADRFHTLELVQVYAAVTYYLQNREAVDAYLARGEERAEATRKRLEENQPPSDAVRRIKAIKVARALAEAEPAS